MAWPQVGGRDLLTMNISRQQQGLHAIEITRPGTNGIALQKVGNRAKPTQMITSVDCDTTAACETELTAYTTMRNTLVTIREPNGTSTANVRIVDVVKVAEQIHVNAVGGVTDGDYVITCQWMIQETQ